MFSVDAAHAISGVVNPPPRDADSHFFSLKSISQIDFLTRKIPTNREAIIILETVAKTMLDCDEGSSG